jgi:HMG (high mobility group) box
MSAFLSYSNSKRRQAKAENPEIGNAEVSRLLAKMWREAPEEERKIHIDKELGLRQEYKDAIAVWRQNADQEIMAVRKEREEIALQRLDAPGEQQYNAAPTAAASSHSLEDKHPQLQNMSSNVQQPVEQDVLNSKGRPKSPSKVARVPAKALYPHSAQSYDMGYPPATAEENHNSGKPQSHVGVESQHGHFRGRPAHNVRVGPSEELSGPYRTRMPVNAHPSEAYGSAEYRVPRNGFGELTGLS